jgi:hypothetical protein
MLVFQHPTTVTAGVQTILQAVCLSALLSRIVPSILMCNFERGCGTEPGRLSQQNVIDANGNGKTSTGIKMYSEDLTTSILITIDCVVNNRPAARVVPGMCQQTFLPALLLLCHDKTYSYLQQEPF